MQQNEKLKNEFQELQLQLARVVSIYFHGPGNWSLNILDPVRCRKIWVLLN